MKKSNEWQKLDIEKKELEIIKCLDFSPTENKIVAGVGFSLKIYKFELDI